MSFCPALLNLRKCFSGTECNSPLRKRGIVIYLPGIAVTLRLLLELSFCSTFTFTHCYENKIHLLFKKKKKSLFEKIEWVEFRI